MNGTALYESLTVLFIAQLHGVRLSFGATVVVALTSAVAAVGAAAIPSAGLVTMLAVLDAAGLGEHAADVGTLLALDWFLDRCRTAVNVEGDLIVAAAVAAWEMDDEERTEGAGRGRGGRMTPSSTSPSTRATPPGPGAHPRSESKVLTSRIHRQIRAFPSPS